jgi:predicted transcriptional regulator
MSDIEDDFIVPVILAIEDEPKKPKRKYTISEKVKARNLINREKFQMINAEKQRKLQEYDKIVNTKSLNKEDVEELLSSKFSELTTKLDELKPTKKQEEVPELLPRIAEEPDDIYQSDGGSQYKRVSTRFTKEYTIPTYSRFRKT